MVCARLYSIADVIERGQKLVIDLQGLPECKSAPWELVDLLSMPQGSRYAYVQVVFHPTYEADDGLMCYISKEGHKVGGILRVTSYEALHGVHTVAHVNLSKVADLYENLLQ